MMFVGRRREIEVLNRLYASSEFQCVIVYGRRRIGKTMLISEFIKDKEAVFFTALEISGQANLEGLSRALIAPDYAGPAPVYSSYEAALEAVYGRVKNKRLVLVIDEYPYLAFSWPGISSLLQKYIDLKFRETPLFLILCGSSMSFMENQVLGQKSPLFGRRTAQIRVNAFDFFDALTFYQKFNPFDLALIYGITGGVPLYMSLMKDGLSVKENVIRNFLEPSAYLFEEPSNLLKQEVREAALYNAVIRAIAQGSSRHSDIASKTGTPTSACTVYLNNLISLGIVKKEFPLGGNSSRRGVYALADSMFRFWYRFIPDNTHLIQNGDSLRAWERIAPQLPTFMGRVFEDICAQYLWRQNTAEKLPFLVSEMGRWWGSDPEAKSEAEIDILGLGDGDRALFGECKWTEERVDTAVLETLCRRSRLFHQGEKYFYLFAKKGFTQGCVKKAAALGNVRLVSLKDMVQP